MQPQYDAITGGTTLRLPAIQSPNYVSGVSGWIIRGDGTVEFNNGLFRGSIQIGTSPGQRFIVNNPATGDVIDIYDSTNYLVFSIDANGVLKASDRLTGRFARISDGILDFGNNASAPSSGASVIGTSSASQSNLRLDSGQSVGTNNSASLQLFEGAGSTAEVRATQRQVSGSVVQCDQDNTNNLAHIAKYHLLTDANGQWNQAHGCGFTPTGAVVSQAGFVGSGSCTFIVIETGFTSSNWQGIVTLNGGLLTNNNVDVYAHLFG